MKRLISTLGLALLAVAAALAVRFSDFGAHQSLSTNESIDGSAREEATLTQQTESTEAGLNESTNIVAQPSTKSDRNPEFADANIDTDTVDEEYVRKRIRDSVTRRVTPPYSLLIDELELTPEEKEALISMLIEDRIASTHTEYSRGQAIDEQERATRIAAIIGESKLQKFLALERDLPAYGEVQKIAAMLDRNDAPLSNSQRDEMLKTLIEVRNQYDTPRLYVKPSGIEHLENRLHQIKERERHVMELAPSVLSSEQVTYLFEQYEYLSYRRADSLESQKEAIANPDVDDLPMHFPLWSD